MKIDAIILRELHLPLVRPFETSFGVTRERRILLAEIKSEGLTGWGECTAGERPFFSGESTDSAWAVIVQELGPMLAAEPPAHGGECPRIFRQVRDNRMAKATLEKFQSEANAFMRTFDQPGNIGKDKFPAININHTQLRGERRERIIGDLWFGA